MEQQRKEFDAAMIQQRETTKGLIARLNEQEAQIQK